MSLAGFQRAFADMVASPALCRAVQRDAAAALGGHELDARELRRLEAVARQRGMEVNCTLYRINRLTPIYAFMPATSALLGERLMAEADAFWAQSQAPEFQYQLELRRFVDFLTHRLARGEVSGPAASYLREVMDFELASFEVQSALSPGHDAAADSSPRRIAFDHAPLQLLRAIRGGALPPYELPCGRFELIMQIRDGDVELSVFDASPAASAAHLPDTASSRSARSVS